MIFENPEREREPRKSVSREQRLRREQESISWEGGCYELVMSPAKDEELSVQECTRY